MQFRVGYYLFAILFLIFDVEAMFMFPWAVIVREMGVDGLLNILFFLLILVLGLAYAWKKELWNGNKRSQHQVDEIRRVQ